MRMHLTMQLKLLPDPAQSASLLATMVRFNAACDALAAVAFVNQCANKVELQKLGYHSIRAEFGLSAQMTVRAIAKVVEVYKRDKAIQPTFRPHGAIVYDERILSWKGSDRVSIWTLDGRALMPWVCGAYQTAFLDRARGQADLIHRDGMFFLYVTIDVGDVPTGDPTEYLGVDLGIKFIAVDSDGQAFSGAHTRRLRERHANLRRRLQRKGTKSAKRLLKRRRLKEHRFATDVNHCISKAIVRKAKDTGRGIGIEDLTHIRGRVTVRKAQRRTLHSWAFGQQRQFMAYKAERDGVPVQPVCPRNSSRECPDCGCVDKRNRPTRDRFECISCGRAGPADEIAAVVIRGRAECHAAERRAA